MGASAGSAANPLLATVTPALAALIPTASAIKTSLPRAFTPLATFPTDPWAAASLARADLMAALRSAMMQVETQISWEDVGEMQCASMPVGIISLSPLACRLTHPAPRADRPPVVRHIHGQALHALYIRMITLSLQLRSSSQLADACTHWGWTWAENFCWMDDMKDGEGMLHSMHNDRSKSHNSQILNVEQPDVAVEFNYLSLHTSSSFWQGCLNLCRTNLKIAVMLSRYRLPSWCTHWSMCAH